MPLDAEQMAQRAKDLLADEAFKDAIETAKRQILAASLRCDAKDDLGRFRLLTAYQVVDGVVNHLNAVVNAQPGAPEPDLDEIYKTRARSKLAFWA